MLSIWAARGRAPEGQARWQWKEAGSAALRLCRSGMVRSVGKGDRLQVRDGHAHVADFAGPAWLLLAVQKLTGSCAGFLSRMRMSSRPS